MEDQDNSINPTESIHNLNDFLSPKDQLKQPLLQQQTTKLINEDAQKSDFEELIKDSLSKQLYYGSDEYLSRPEKAKSSDFLENVTYQIDLSKLYKIVKTCYMNQNMPYCPILVENTQEGCQMQYQLQVWNQHQQMVYSKDLLEEPVAWFVTFNTLVYKPAPRDQESNQDCYFIVFLYKGNSYMKVDVANQPFGSIEKPVIGLCNRCLYISSDSQIHIINCIQTRDLKNGEFELINDYKDDLRKPKVVDLGDKVKNRGFILNLDKYGNDYLIMSCETSDGQIDFSLISYKISDRSYTIKQIQEVIQRPDGTKDKIVQFKQVQTKKWPYAIVLRESGKVDFYWNYLRIGHAKSEDAQKLSEKCFQVDVNFKCFYLRFFTSNKQISLDWNGRIGLDVAEQFDQQSIFSFENIFQQMISEKVNFFHTSALINTSFFIAHNNLIYMYDIIRKCWNKNPYICELPILKLFRCEKEPGLYNIGVMLEDGSFDIIENSDFQSLKTTDWTHCSFDDKPKIQGKIKQIASDSEHYRLLYVLSETDQGLQLQAYTRNSIHIITGIKGLCETSRVYPLFAPQKDSTFIVQNISPSNEITLQIFQATFKLGIDKIEKMTSKQIRTINFTMQRDDLIQFKEKDLPNTSLTQNIDGHIVLVGKQQMYKVDVSSGTAQIIQNTNISGIQVIDDNHCYAIINNNPQEKSKSKESGLKYFSLKMLLDCLEVRFLDIDVAIAGPQSFIDYSEDNERLTYLKSYEQANIIPILHRSTINFMGMLPRQNYLAVKKIKNQFLALDKHNRITVWNVLTGKLIKEIQLEQDYSGYEIFGTNNFDMTYQREWYQPRTLIVQLQNTHDVFQHSQTQFARISNEIKSGLAFVYNENINFNTFKLIEIENENSVIEHCHFIHQNYIDKFQKILISDDNELMIEILVNLRVNVYQSRQSKGGAPLKWMLQKRFQDFPHDLSEISECLFMFSPNLQRYINFDKVKGLFFIRSTLNKDIDIQIPQRLMNPQNENPKESVKRFKWVNNERILIANSSGYECLFNLNGDQFEEISQSIIPCFKSLEKLNHIYQDQESLELGDIIKRLLRKYRDLKRLRYLDEKQYQIQIYDHLFEVDFNVQKGKYKHVSDLSFSFIYWKVIEDLIKGHIKIESLDEQTLLTICLNILPGCRNILHMLANKSQLLQKLLQIVPVYQCTEIMKVKSEFEMPFIADLHNKTPLHLCIDNQDYKTADFLINYLANAPIDHHGKAIKDILHKLIIQDLPSMISYLDQRRIQTDAIKKINRGHIIYSPEHKDVSFATTSIWIDSKEIRSQLFTHRTEKNKKKNVQSDVELYFIDLPNCHFLNLQDGQRFFDALKDSQKLELFQIQTVRYLIDYLWPMVKQATKRTLLFPFIMYLIIYWVYSNLVYDFYLIDEARGFWVLLVNQILLCGLSVYFLFYEYRQMISAGLKDYLSSPWNYIDLTPPIIILSQAVLTFINRDGDFERILQTIQSLSSLLLWMKLLYFFRINKSTGYLIRMIAKVIVGIKTFLGVLLITIVAFGDGFASLQDDKFMGDIKSSEGFFDYLQKCFGRFFTSHAKSVNLNYWASLLQRPRKPSQ
eukprot:403332513